MTIINRLVLISVLSLLFLFLIPTPSHAVLRYAECDACGYCIDREAPESWESCKACLYPLITGAPGDNKTLEVITNLNDPRLDPAKKALNQPVPPARGKYFTQLGCVDASLSSFSDPGAAGGVLNFILTKLIFPATGVLAFGTLIYGSFILITAQGAEMQIARGKRYVTGSIVGLIFTFSVVLMVNIIGGDVLRIPGFGEKNVYTDLQKIKVAIDTLIANTGRLPRGSAPPTTCVHDLEIELNKCEAGLVCDTWPYGGAYNKQLTVAEVTDPWGNPYYFDPDYRCRPDVEGCENIVYGPENSQDTITKKSKFVRAILSFGADGREEYCNPPNNGCVRRDEDNIVLVLCDQ